METDTSEEFPIFWACRLPMDLIELKRALWSSMEIGTVEVAAKPLQRGEGAEEVVADRQISVVADVEITHGTGRVIRKMQGGCKKAQLSCGCAEWDLARFRIS